MKQPARTLDHAGVDRGQVQYIRSGLALSGCILYQVVRLVHLHVSGHSPQMTMTNRVTLSGKPAPYGRPPPRDQASQRE